MQMNLCLSGLAGCYGKVAYPAAVEEAVARIRQARPDAVTVNEACRGDIAEIARRGGYHLRFSRVPYLGKPLRCVKPGGRGLFGDAVLTRAAIEGTDNEDFDSQAGPERRRWLCVSTRVDVDVCTAHLKRARPSRSTGTSASAPSSRRSSDVAREPHAPSSSAVTSTAAAPAPPPRAWTRTDSAADQAPGIQHVYGRGALRSPSAKVLPAAHTDHDVLLVSAQLRRATLSAILFAPGYSSGETILEANPELMVGSPSRHRCW